VMRKKCQCYPSERLRLKKKLSEEARKTHSNEDVVHCCQHSTTDQHICGEFETNVYL
jgi:hypothetical protein